MNRSITRIVLVIALGAASIGAVAVKPLEDVIDGTWAGAIAGRLRFVLHVERGTDGALKATADSPDQGAMGLRVDEITTRGDSLFFTMTQYQGSFAGAVNLERNQIDGLWRQGNALVGLSVVKQATSAASAALAEKPQNPKKPYPYESIDVKYTNRKDSNVTLAGTLTIPKGVKRAPCAVLITGSGPEDRDETVFGHKPFLVLADYLTRHGIAVLRSDDRGVGGSTGSMEGATSEDFASDVDAAVAYLRTRKDIDPARIGLIGHSEGALIGPMVAARDKSIAFLVMLAGPGVPGDQILIQQSLKVSQSMGFTNQQAEDAQNAQRELIAAAKAPTDSTEFVKKLTKIIEEQMEKLPADQKRGFGDIDQIAVGQAKILRAPWMTFFLSHDPRPTLAQVKCPVLALNGEKDIQIGAEQNLPEIRTALQKGGNTKATVEALPGLNHLFQTAERGAIDEYATILETFAPSALQKISDWIGATVGRGK